MVNTTISLADDQRERLELEFDDTDYLIQEYIQESQSHIKAKRKGPTKYKRGKGKCFDYEVNMVCRKHQEHFIFLGLSIKKGFRDKQINHDLAKRGFKRTRKDKMIFTEGTKSLEDTPESMEVDVTPQASASAQDPVPGLANHPVMVAQKRPLLPQFLKKYKSSTSLGKSTRQIKCQGSILKYLN